MLSGSKARARLLAMTRGWIGSARQLAVMGLALLTIAASFTVTDASKLLAKVRAERDDVKHSVFTELGKLGDEESFRALRQATGLVNDQRALYAAYGALKHYKEDEQLATASLEMLEKDALRAHRVEAQRAATWTLSYFGDRGLAPLERVVRGSKDDVSRIYAIRFLFKTLGERGDADAAELILDNEPLSGDAQYEDVLEALERCKDKKSRKLMLAKLKDEESSRRWKLAIVEVLEADADVSVTRAFVKALEQEEGDRKLRLRLIDELGRRRAERAPKAIKPHLKSGNAETRRAAVLAISRIEGPDKNWLKRLHTYAQDEDAVMRLAAAIALTELGVDDCYLLLAEFLDDSDPRVRAEAVELIAGQREVQAVPLLIARLDEEHGALRLRIARVLRLLTGQDFGYSGGRWGAWWRAEGEGFELPTSKEALALEYERRASKAAEGQSQSTFYGLPVLSRNVCFVLDVSGSMATEVAGRPSQRTSSEEQPKDMTRLDIAKEELTAVLAGLPADTYANIVFFETSARAWEDKLVALDEKNREAAVKYVQQRKAAGGTDVHEGLELAFADKRVDTIYILTDGRPSIGLFTDPTRLREEVAAWNAVRCVQIHCVWVGRNSNFLRDLARDHGGDYRVAE